MENNEKKEYNDSPINTHESSYKLDTTEGKPETTQLVDSRYIHQFGLEFKAVSTGRLFLQLQTFCGHSLWESNN